MKQISYVVLVLSCVCIMLSSCSESSSLTSFSKRKYLKKAPKQKAIEQVYDEPISYAGKEFEYSNYVLEEMPEIDEEIEAVHLIILNKNKENPSPAYLVKNRISIIQKTPEFIEEPELKKKVHPLAILAALCFFPGILLVIPFLATIPLSIIALNKIKKEPNKYTGEGLARTILTLAIVITVLIVIIAVIFVLISGTGFGGPT